MDVRIWRNWQTRTVQVRVLARAWRFKSSYPHHAGHSYRISTSDESARRYLKYRIASIGSEAALLKIILCKNIRKDKKAVKKHVE